MYYLTKSTIGQFYAIYIYKIIVRYSGIEYFQNFKYTSYFLMYNINVLKQYGQSCKRVKNSGFYNFKGL